jgi:hypothetical protein
MKYKNEVPMPVTDWMARARRTIPLPDEPWNKTIDLPHYQVVRTRMFVMLIPRPNKFKMAALQQAIQSGEFLIIRPENGTLIGGKTYEAMQCLSLSIEHYTGLYDLLPTHQEQMQQLRESSRNKVGVTISADLFHLLYALHDRLQDILRLIIALLAYIEKPDRELQMPTLNPINPIASEAEKIAAERPTHEEIQRWVNDIALRELITTESLATTEEVSATWTQSPALAGILESLTQKIIPHIEELRERLEQDGQQAAAEWLQSTLRQEGD